MSYGKQEQICQCCRLKRNGKSHPTRHKNGYEQFRKKARKRVLRRLAKADPENAPHKLPYLGYE